MFTTTEDLYGLSLPRLGNVEFRAEGFGFRPLGLRA